MRKVISQGTRGAAVVGLLAAAGVIGATPAAAYSCVPGSPEENAANAQAVFVGTTSSQPTKPNVFPVEVDAVYKGDPDPTVVVDGGNWSMSNGFNLDPGQQYVFYAQPDRNGAWQVRVCEGTTPASGRATAIAQRLLGPPTPAEPPEAGQPAGAPTGPAGPASATPAADRATDDGMDWRWLSGGAAVATALVVSGLLARRRAPGGLTTRPS